MSKVPRECAESNADSEPLSKFQVRYRLGVRRQTPKRFPEDMMLREEGCLKIEYQLEVR